MSHPSVSHLLSKENHEVYSGGRGGLRSMMLMSFSSSLQEPPAELTCSNFIHLQLYSTSTFTVHHTQPVLHLLETCSFITFGFAQFPNCTSLPTTGELFTALGSPVRGTYQVPSFHPLLPHSHPVPSLAKPLLSHHEDAPLHYPFCEGHKYITIHIITTCCYYLLKEIWLYHTIIQGQAKEKLSK